MKDIPSSNPSVFESPTAHRLDNNTTMLFSGQRWDPQEG